MGTQTDKSKALGGKDSGTYVNEANPFTPDWRNAWWGDGYEGLLAVKKKYDPDGLLKCWKCVGFDESEMLEDRFKCMGKVQAEVDKAFR